MMEAFKLQPKHEMLLEKAKKKSKPDLKLNVTVIDMDLKDLKQHIDLDVIVYIASAPKTQYTPSANLDTNNEKHFSL